MESNYSDHLRSDHTCKSAGQCAVCGDKGTGYHYAVYTCEGCKGFFKRTVQNSLKYVCRAEKNCQFDKSSRNDCQYCRYRQCLDVGMKTYAVRQDRAPGGKARVKRSRLDSEKAEMRHAGPSAKPQDPVSTLSEEDQRLVSRLVATNADAIPLLEDVYPGYQPGMGANISVMVNYYYAELRNIICWSRKVPGFSDLTTEDQMALVRSSFPDLCVFRVVFRSIEHFGSFQFATGLILTSEECIKAGYGETVGHLLLEFISSLRATGIDATEFSILNAILLTYPDAVGLADRAAVMALQSQFLGCLQKYCMAQYPAFRLRHAKILLCLPELRTVSTQATDRFLGLTLDNEVLLNPLTYEMLNCTR